MGGITTIVKAHRAAADFSLGAADWKTACALQCNLNSVLLILLPML
jgi:hypothetical protein